MWELLEICPPLGHEMGCSQGMAWWVKGLGEKGLLVLLEVESGRINGMLQHSPGNVSAALQPIEHVERQRQWWNGALVD
jgi:hypothetical protein